nr:Gfo/Idh/MocA family oxidoreductase [Hoeflea sp.]
MRPHRPGSRSKPVAHRRRPRGSRRRRLSRCRRGAGGQDRRESHDERRDHRRSSIQAVVIGTPTDTHFDLIEASAKAGKAIFCEKPVDMSAARIRELIKIVEGAGVPILTGFNRPFARHPRLPCGPDDRRCGGAVTGNWRPWVWLDPTRNENASGAESRRREVLKHPWTLLSYWTALRRPSSVAAVRP